MHVNHPGFPDDDGSKRATAVLVAGIVAACVVGLIAGDFYVVHQILKP